MSDTDVASTDAAPAELPGDGLREGIVDDLRAAIGDGLIVVHLVPQDDLWVRVAPEAHVYQSWFVCLRYRTR